MLIHSAIERGEVEIPIDALMHSDGTLSVYPEVQLRKYVEIRSSAGRVYAAAGKYIGLIPLNSEHAIRVQPKVPIKSLVQLLTTAKENPEVLHTLETIYTAGEHLDIFDLLVRAFHQELRVLDQGVHREYLRGQDERASFGGKVLFNQTIERQWAKGIYQRATVAFFEHSRDTVINRTIVYTTWQLLRLCSQAGGTAPNVLQDFDSTLRMLQRVALDRSRSFLPAFRELMLRNQIPNSRAYLRGLLSLCLILLDDLGVDLNDLYSRDVALPPLIVNMERAFQRFVFNVVRAGLDVSRPHVVVWDTAQENQWPLLANVAPSDLPEGIELAWDPGNTAEPDFVLAGMGGPKIACDVKYTADISRGHVYQVVSHALAYNATAALLICVADDASPGAMFCLGAIGGIRVFVFHFPLQRELELANAGFRAALESLVDSVGLAA